MTINRLRLKINIFGQVTVGKTTFTQKLSMNDYETIMTSGANILRKDLQIDEREIQFLIWDKAGPEKFYPYKHLYSNTDGGIFMYDITNKSSLNDISKWIKNFRDTLEGKNKDIPILMLGNKIDLEDKREVSKDYALELVKKYNIFDLIEISAKT
ncbi:MAG: Rab family GTPase, partial [Candidatus Thorarchaeota archaeon]